MTKIFEAYKKSTVGLTEMVERMKREGTPQLFPPPSEAQQEEFVKLASRLLSFKRDGRGSTISLASSTRGEGTSFVSFSLAMLLSIGYEQKVAWLDANFRTPQRRLMTHDEITLAGLLRNPALADDLPCGPSRLTLVPGGGDLRDERAHFADGGLSELMARMSERFDFTLLDLPPVLESQESALMARCTDGLLLVVAQKHLKRESIAYGVKSLGEIDVNVMGAVVNKREYELPEFLHRWV